MGFPSVAPFLLRKSGGNATTESSCITTVSRYASSSVSAEVWRIGHEVRSVCAAGAFQEDALFIVTAVLLVGTLLATPTPESPVVEEPKSPHAYVEDLIDEGLRNGRLPHDRLVEVPTDQQACLVETEAADAWRRLVARAGSDGVDLSPGWCYRSISAQKQTYIRNCGSLSARQSSCSPATSRPGMSNHGWGRAIDITSGGRVVGCGSDAYQWLTENAADFGWVNPEWAQCGRNRSEPWHWEWGGIDAADRTRTRHVFKAI